jgi:putative Ca2+/H+ antiporter (TMEM165/GDT1 family)
MRHTHKLVFAGAIAALASMTILSVLLGSALSFLPKSYLHYRKIVLFIGCGLKLFFDANRPYFRHFRSPLWQNGAIARKFLLLRWRLPIHPSA